MRVLVQRVSSARVVVDGAVTGEIGNGLLVFVCAMRGDTEKESEWLARKLVNLRIFRDEADRMNRSLADVGGAALIVSQFTLAAETVANGIFGADMRVELANDGPVTIWLDTASG